MPSESDPYAVLQLPPTATQPAITAAYRRLAKILYPDVPETGDEDAFVHLQRAYHLLSDPTRRAAHDQERRRESRPAWRSTEAELGFTRAIAWRWPRLVVPALAVMTLLALVQVGVQFARPVPTPMVPAPPSTNTAQPPAPVPIPARSVIPPISDFAAADHYIAPGPPLLLQPTAARLDAFTPVVLASSTNAEGRALIRTGTGATGMIDTTRLLPGDARAARQAACLHVAVAPPRSGQILLHRANGPARTEIENRDDRPAVFKLRDATGAAIAAIYLAPRGKGTLENLPAGPLRAEYALGDLWSASCGLFTAGMRALVFDAPVLPGEPVSLPPRAATDIPDEVFARD